MIIMHIWTIENWYDVLDYENHNYRTGLRLVFDKGVDEELRCACKQFAKYLRQEYFFPVRVPMYFKNQKKVKCMDGDYAYGTFFRPYSYQDEPYIRIAVRDFRITYSKYGRNNACFSIFQTMVHELTHYFQWVNGLKLTPIGEERQATMYEHYVLDEYSDIWDWDKDNE